MNSSANDGEHQGEIFLDENDIVEEINVNEEDEADNSLHIFTVHTGEVNTVVCNPNENTLGATGAGDDKGFLWMINQGDWDFELQVLMDNWLHLEALMGLFKYGTYLLEILNVRLMDL